MEIRKTANDFGDEIAYQRAKKKARKIRDFYISLSLFCLIMPIIIFINLYFVPQFHWFWFSILGWGTGLVFHGLTAFEIHPLMKNNWEQRKIQQFIQEDIEKEKVRNNDSKSHR